MSKSSKRWVQEHNRDRYVQLSRSRQLRSRAVFKLEELDQRHKLFRAGQTVVDLGAAPGSWSVYARDRVGPGGTVIAVDVLDIQPLSGVLFLQCDLTDAASRRNCMAELGKYEVDLVISDMAPNLSGIAAMDQANSLALAQTAAQIAGALLRRRGQFLVKLFQGADSATFRKQLLEKFDKVLQVKPQASRAKSSEVYMLAKGHRAIECKRKTL